MFYSGSDFQSRSKHQSLYYVLVLLFLHPCSNFDSNIMGSISPTRVVFTAGTDKTDSALQIGTLFIGQERLILPSGRPYYHGLEHRRQFAVAVAKNQLPWEADQAPTSVQHRWPRLLAGLISILQTLPAESPRRCTGETFSSTRHNKRVKSSHSKSRTMDLSTLDGALGSMNLDSHRDTYGPQTPRTLSFSPEEPSTLGRGFRVRQLMEHVCPIMDNTRYRHRRHTFARQESGLDSLLVSYLQLGS